MPCTRKRPTKVAWPFLKNEGSDQAENLVGWWPGIGNGRVLDDMSGFRNHGIMNSFASPMTSASGWAPGVVGLGKSALAFDAVDDFVDCGANACLDITGDLTLSAFVKSKSIGVRQTFFSKGDFNGNHGTYMFQIKDTGLLLFGNTAANEGTQGISGVKTLAANTLYHLVATFVASTKVIRLYVNALQDATAAISTGPPSRPTDHLLFGELGFTGSTIQLMNGTTEDQRIYNRCLSAAEVAAIYERPGELRYVPGRKVWSFAPAVTPAANSNFFQMF